MEGTVSHTVTNVELVRTHHTRNNDGSISVARTSIPTHTRRMKLLYAENDFLIHWKARLLRRLQGLRLREKPYSERFAQVEQH